MSTYKRNRATVLALVDRKVQPLGAEDRTIAAAKRRAWASVCRGERAMVAIRNAVSYAAANTDRLANGQREGRR